MDYQLHTFSNGLRLAHFQVNHTNIAHGGFILDIGSRDEILGEEGIAHFWEHMAFKGTQKRRAYHILSRVDALGGELNAYTTREKICFYASLLHHHFEKAIELLTDITFNAVFPEKEIIKERGVILEEMSMYEDDPSDALADEFDEVIFGDHSLGKNILGTRQSVSSFRQSNFLDFLSKNLDTERIIFSSVGPWSFSKVVRVTTKYLEPISPRSGQQNRTSFQDFSPKSIQKVKPIQQAHCIIGTEGCSLFDKKRLPFFLLTNLLGGPGMNSRLNLAIREKYGFVYSIDAQTTFYIDSGLFSILFATEPKTLERCIRLVRKELKKLREQQLGHKQLHSAKQQLMGQLAMADESNLGLMLLLGKSLLDLGRVEGLSQIFERIEAISSLDILEVANEKLADETLSQLVFIPE